jgi:hypothetical protein
VAHQIRSEHNLIGVSLENIDPSLEADYYKDRGMAILFFIVNGLLLAAVLYSIANAL